MTSFAYLCKCWPYFSISALSFSHTRHCLIALFPMLVPCMCFTLNRFQSKLISKNFSCKYNLYNIHPRKMNVRTICFHNEIFASRLYVEYVLSLFFVPRKSLRKTICFSYELHSLSFSWPVKLFFSGYYRSTLTIHTAIASISIQHSNTASSAQELKRKLKTARYTHVMYIVMYAYDFERQKKLLRITLFDLIAFIWCTRGETHSA